MRSPARRDRYRHPQVSEANTMPRVGAELWMIGLICRARRTLAARWHPAEDTPGRYQMQDTGRDSLITVLQCNADLLSSAITDARSSGGRVAAHHSLGHRHGKMYGHCSRQQQASCDALVHLCPGTSGQVGMSTCIGSFGRFDLLPICADRQIWLMDAM